MVYGKKFKSFLMNHLLFVKVVKKKAEYISSGDGWYKDGYSSSQKNEGVDSGAAQLTTDHEPDRRD